WSKNGQRIEVLTHSDRVCGPDFRRGNTDSCVHHSGLKRIKITDTSSADWQFLDLSEGDDVTSRQLICCRQPQTTAQMVICSFHPPQLVERLDGILQLII